MTTLQELITQILAEDPRARDDDLWLTIQVWRHYTKFYIPYQEVDNLPRPESISRIRRHIQHDLGLFPGQKGEERAVKSEESRRYWATVEGED